MKSLLIVLSAMTIGFGETAARAELVGTWNGVTTQKHFKTGESSVTVALRVSRQEGELKLEEVPDAAALNLPVYGSYRVDSMGDVYQMPKTQRGQKVKVGSISQDRLEIGVESPNDHVMRRIRIEENPLDSSRATMSYTAGDEENPLRNLSVTLIRD